MDANMTLQEIKEKKQTLESDILRLIREFQKQTNLNIVDLKMLNETRVGYKYPAITAIEIDCKL